MNFNLGAMLLLGLPVLWSAEGTNLAKNVQEFNALCRLFRIAYESRDKQPEDLIKGEMDWGKIEALYTDREKFANATEKPPVEVDMGTLGKVRITSGHSLARVHTAALLVARQIDNLRELSSSEKERALAAARNVIGGLKKALAGEKQQKLGQIDEEPPGLIKDDKSNEPRSEACAAKTKESQYAGISLSNDLACLCIPGDTGDTYHKEICGFVSAGTSNFWTASTSSASVATQLKAGWVEVVNACKGEKGLGTDLTPEDITSALGIFNALLGAQSHIVASGTTGKVAKWVLGVPLSNGPVTCVAGSGSSRNNVCVNYGHASSGAYHEILWRTRMENVRDGLLQIRAAKEEGTKIYEKALRIVERQNEAISSLNISDTLGVIEANLVKPGQGQNLKEDPLTSTDKPSVQSPTTVSTATLSCFFFPWTLLI